MAATLRIPIGVSDLSINALLPDRNGNIWNGSSFVAPSGLADEAAYSALLINCPEVKLSDNTKTGIYALTVPSAIDRDVYVEVYNGSFSLPHLIYWLGSYTLYSTVDLIANVGDGAYTVTITVVNESAEPIENATVRITLGATSYVAETDSYGEASFSCDAGTWTVGITAAGYANFTPVSLVISDDIDQEYELSAASYGDTYAEAQDIYDIFGENNVKIWANMHEYATSDPSYSSHVLSRISKALEYATADMDDLLRGGPYDIPFTGSAITTTVKRCCALKAGSWLFEWRRDQDEDRYAKMEIKADKILEQIRKDVRRFNNTYQTIKGTRAPSVVA